MRARLTLNGAVAICFVGALALTGCVSDDPGVAADGPERPIVDDTATDATTPGTDRPPRSTTTTTATTTTTSAGAGGGSGAIGSSGNPTTAAAPVVGLWPDATDAFTTFANQTCSVLSSVSFWAEGTEGWNATRRVVTVFADLEAPPALAGYQRDLVTAFGEVIDRAESTNDTIGDDTDPTNVVNDAARDAGLTMCVAAGPDGRGYSVGGTMFDGQDQLDANGIGIMVDYELDLRDPFLLLDSRTRSCVRSKALAEPDIRDKFFLSGLTDEFETWAGECGTTVKAGFNYLERAE
jgi:hypothetical protein